MTATTAEITDLITSTGATRSDLLSIIRLALMARLGEIEDVNLWLNRKLAELHNTSNHSDVQKNQVDLYDRAAAVFAKEQQSIDKLLSELKMSDTNRVLL